MTQELIVDSFAGGGGASLGIAWATGRAPDIAINHDADALAMHAANHPSTRHVNEDVWHAKLRELVAGRPVGLLWASPDCKDFSRAKGGVPVSKDIRSLAWIVVRWASQVKPRVIVLENVREFADWGPLAPQWACQCGWKGTEGQATLARTRRRCPRCNSLRIVLTTDLVPDPDKRGMTFRLFANRLRGLGYDVQWKNLNAADYGAPTHRRRLFLIARCDGAPIVWPEPTHGDPKKLDATPLFAPLKPWRTAAECIDWSIPCPSIFDRKRPLAEKTMRRIAMGIKRYVLDNPQPFVVQVTHAGERRSNGVDEPLPTITSAHRGEHAIVTPIVSKYHGQKANESRCSSPDVPFNTLDTQNRYGIIAPTLIQTGYGERPGYYRHTCETEGGPIGRESTSGARCKICGEKPTWHEAQAPRAPGLDKPLGTVVSGGAKHAVVSAHIARQFGNSVGQDMEEPLGTVTAGGGGKSQLVSAFLAKHFGGVVGVPADTPLPTTTARGTQNQIVAANLIHLNHGEKQWNGVDEPSRTITSNNHAALVYSFLVKYFGTAIGQPADEPLSTVTGKHRHGLVTVSIDGQSYVIVDIGMRMLTSRELARAQGFPDTYLLTGTKTNQVAKIGNSVVPHCARALVAANFTAAFAEVRT